MHNSHIYYNLTSDYDATAISLGFGYLLENKKYIGCQFLEPVIQSVFQNLVNNTELINSKILDTDPIFWYLRKMTLERGLFAEYLIRRIFMLNENKNLVDFFDTKKLGIDNKSFIYKATFGNIIVCGSPKELKIGIYDYLLPNLVRKINSIVVPPHKGRIDICVPINCSETDISYAIVQVKFWDTHMTMSSLYTALESLQPNSLYTTKDSKNTESYINFRISNKQLLLFKKTIRVIVSLSGFTDTVFNNVSIYNSQYLDHPILLFCPNKSHYGGLMEKYIKKTYEIKEVYQSGNEAAYNLDKLIMDTSINTQRQPLTFEAVPKMKRKILMNRHDGYHNKTQNVDDDDPIEFDEIDVVHQTKKKVNQLMMMILLNLKKITHQKVNLVLNLKN